MKNKGAAKSPLGSTIKRVGITDTSLRDAHQSLLATRMRIEDILPVVEKLDQVGFHAMEVWGGATFDTCLRYLGEDPWERLRQIRARSRHTPLMMLLRGQNLVGYRHYPDDVVEAFVKRSIHNGIDILRIFDALNDLRNLRTAIRAAKDAGGQVQGTVVYTKSPVHSPEHLVEAALALAEMGADSICLKDMAGLLSPGEAETIVGRLKEEVPLPLEIHSHCTSGLASMSYLKAIEAGVDVVDTAISSLSLGTSQPPTESLAAALAGTAWEPDLDLGLLAEVAEHFRTVRRKYAEFDVGTTVDAAVLRYQIPGGMISNFTAQLAQQRALDKLPQVLEEVERVREELGYPPLVTPSSQVVGAQAVLNVLGGERYKLVANEVKQYLRGFYGQPPGPVSEIVRRKVVGDEVPISCRPAELLPPGMEAARREIAPYAETEEDVLSFAIFPVQTKKLLQERLAATSKVDYCLLEAAEGGYPTP